MSIQTAFAMTYGGARGDTAAEMASVLRFADHDGDVHRAAAGLVRALSTPRDTHSLRIANRIFAEQSFTWREPFVALTRDVHGAPMEAVDFRRHPEASRQRVNTWVAERTDAHIRDLLPAGSIDDNSRMVLTNAVYFDAEWESPFEPGETYSAPFLSSDGQATERETMHQSAPLAYAQVADAQLLELPYRGGDLSMVIALPTHRGGLQALEASMDGRLYDSWIAQLETTRVNVSLPSFRVEPRESIRLNETLRSMGMREAFDRVAADFTGLADLELNGSHNLFISGAFHKAFVAVDEAGTEAAAATAVVISEETAREVPEGAAFTADHPFLFFIRDVHSGAILFMGRVTDPA